VIGEGRHNEWIGKSPDIAGEYSPGSGGHIPGRGEMVKFRGGMGMARPAARRFYHQAGSCDVLLPSRDQYHCQCDRQFDLLSLLPAVRGLDGVCKTWHGP